MVPCSRLPAAGRSAGVSRPWSAELRTMWVRGSLIRSSTWRSSSVSAPCISSSICLPSSPERSRTMRGSFCQALPIGCIRVFMTPSCSSAVTLESRCSGTLNSVSSLRLEISSSWLRVRTSSETMVMRCSSVSTLTRIDWLATLSASATSPSAAAAAALRPSSPSGSSATAGFGAGAARARPRSRSRGRHAPVHRARLRPDAAGAPESGHQRALRGLFGRLRAGGGEATGERSLGRSRGCGRMRRRHCAMPRSTMACSLTIRSRRCLPARSRWPPGLQGSP